MTTRLLAPALVLLLMSAGLQAGGNAHRSGDEVERETIVETIPRENARGMTIDNFNGSITVSAGTGSEIRMTAVRTIRGFDTRDISLGRREVSLKIEREGRWIYICVDGPFKDPYDCRKWNQRNRHESDYTVIYDFEVEVPRQIDYELGTIHGDIVVSDVRGDFSVHTVEGEVDVTGAAGSGFAQSVNGPVRVSFSENPTEDSRFGTVNGDVSVSFEPGLSADLTFETMTGEVLTDFEYTPLSLQPQRVENRGRNSTAFKIELQSGVRIADGGPRFRFSNINGNILIHKNR